jgi:hypothetical protein
MVIFMGEEEEEATEKISESYTGCHFTTSIPQSWLFTYNSR